MRRVVSVTMIKNVSRRLLDEESGSFAALPGRNREFLQLLHGSVDFTQNRLKSTKHRSILFDAGEKSRRATTSSKITIQVRPCPEVWSLLRSKIEIELYMYIAVNKIA